MPPVRYSPATIAKQSTATSVSHTVETDLAIVSDPRYLENAQLSIYIKQTLGSATKVSFGYYFSFDYDPAAPSSATWYKVCIRDLSTNKGDLVDIPMYVDSNSPAQSGVIMTVDNLPTSGASAFKVTGLAATADAGANELTVMSRDN